MRPRWILSVALLAAAGCTHETFDPTAKKPSALFTSTEVKKAKDDGPKRQPKAETCAAYGAAAEQSGDSAKDAAAKAQFYKQSRTAYQQALGIDAKNRTALLGMGRLLTKEGNHQKAVEQFNLALKTYPQDAEIWHELGMCWGKQKQWSEAISALSQAVRIDPQNATYSNNYGWTLARSGRFQESFEFFSKTVGEAQANCNLARMSLHLGNPNMGRRYAEAALRVDPQFQPAQDLLAQISETGETEAQTAGLNR